ncbi:membrane-bound lytic murein transglycosylase A [Defluviimonas denitrificans]|uniref:peptidoglycan lytic exotransglycosylase n=1 Tax=Albidovulum denitrificans TaxID=404881 RepID=A0A2S8S744_9RHOB|nr:MltA domain-containing protein [Defluviimonas denitrificans]PQV56620.1 membrane-bound lytic murein transglycosylase A [Defluviimonas denitrificans]
MPGRAKSPAGIPGWAAEDHAAAYAVWHLTAPDTASVPDARRFFETAFEAEPRPCHCTGYYEPELSGSLTPDARFRHPLYALPPDLPPDRPWFSRAEIAEGDLLAGRELVWLDSAIEGFLAQVQGSVRVRVENGTVLRFGYAGKNGHPYRSIGQELIRRGEVDQNAMSADAIRDWCAAHPNRVADLLATNPSFVFFRPLDLPETLGPIGASGVPLTPLRSLAADPDHIAPGTPVWVECGAQQALFIAQDTGSAIKGPGRIDLFCGSGAAAGRMASGLNAQGTIHVLYPRAAG